MTCTDPTDLEPDAEAIVDSQHRAYNDRDLAAYCQLFTRDVRTVNVTDGSVLVDGIDALRAHYARRFSEAPDLHCTVLNRLVAGNQVIDHERVEGLGPVPVEVVAAYEVQDGRIKAIRFLSV